MLPNAFWPLEEGHVGFLSFKLHRKSQATCLHNSGWGWMQPTHFWIQNACSHFIQELVRALAHTFPLSDNKCLVSLLNLTGNSINKSCWDCFEAEWNAYHRSQWQLNLIRVSSWTTDLHKGILSVFARVDKVREKQGLLFVDSFALKAQRGAKH